MVSWMKRSWVIVLVVIGCGPKVGRELQQSQVDKIVVGTTTWPEAEKTLGPPTSLFDTTNAPATEHFSKQCGAENDPIKVAQYSFIDGDRHGSKQFLVDAKGVVCDIKSSSGTIQH